MPKWESSGSKLLWGGRGDSAHLIDGMTLNAYERKGDFACLSERGGSKRWQLWTPTALNAYEGKGDLTCLAERGGFECLWGEGWLCTPNRWDDSKLLWGKWWLYTLIKKRVALNAYEGKGDLACLSKIGGSECLWGEKWLYTPNWWDNSKCIWLWMPMMRRVTLYT